MKLVKSNFKDKKKEKIIHNAIRSEKLNTYIKHPETGEPMKLPKEIAKRIVNGEKISFNDILNYKEMN